MELRQVAVLLVFVLFIAAFVKSRRKRHGHRYAPGSGAAGAVYDMHSDVCERASIFRLITLRALSSAG